MFRDTGEKATLGNEVMLKLVFVLFSNVVQYILSISVLIILYILWLLVSFQRLLISSFGDDCKAFRDTVWHCRSFVEGSMMFKPNLLCGS